MTAAEKKASIGADDRLLGGTEEDVRQGRQEVGSSLTEPRLSDPPPAGATRRSSRLTPDHRQFPSAGLVIAGGTNDYPLYQRSSDNPALWREG